MQSRFLLLSLALALLPCAPAGAQGRPSEHGTVSQTVAGTTLTVEYDRPSARGRDPLFGGVVKWGEKWTPGANWATTLEVDRAVEVNGHALPKGKYSVWMIPQPREWTVILHRSARRYHTQRPNEADEQLRFTVPPEEGAHMETLAWYFPEVRRDGATLRMHWGSTIVPIRVQVRDSSR